MTKRAGVVGGVLGGATAAAAAAVVVVERRTAAGWRLEQLTVAVGQTQDRYAAHRVTDQHDRSGRHQCAEHGVQIAAELVDRRQLRVAVLGATVAALIVEDHPDGIAELFPHALPLEVERVHIQRVSVDEHDSERRVDRTHFLVVQARAVVSDHRALPVVR